MNNFRTHLCNQLTDNDKGHVVKLCGWVHRKRDHGNLLFIDLRDNYGIAQCVIESNSEINFLPYIDKVQFGDKR